ncbi:MAG TPA: histidine kinase [Pedobacter sp.]|nr:histidine kinase [Pedobacter sp.]
MIRSTSHVLFLLLSLFVCVLDASAQHTDSWKQVQQNKRGTVMALWYDIDPFIFEAENGKLQGVEYELMMSFADWVKKRYGYQISITWKNATSFENIYAEIKQAKVSGLFGWSFFSITPKRQTEVRFTPPYMPDMNVLVTNDAVPLYNSKASFLNTISQMHGYTMRHTAMEEDLGILTQGQSIPISRQYDDYEILKRIAENKNAFGYVPLTVYVVSLQKGIKVKRQHLFATERQGLSGIFPLHSDWQPIVDEYFQGFECKRLADKLLSKYLGAEIGKIIMEDPGKSEEDQRSGELELLMKEREIVSQRLVNTLLTAERDKTLRNISIMVVFIVIIISALLFNQYRIKTELSKILIQRNTLIRKQNRDIERINRKLHMRVLQAQINPHFVFNSLNDLQYYINKGEKEISLGYVARFSRFMRELLSQANDPEVSLDREQQFLKLYLDLEKTRFTGKFNYTMESDHDLPSGLSGIPPLILYHFIENALYHGILNNEKPGEISVNFAYQNPYLVCIIQDNGCGRSRAKALNANRTANESTPYKKLLRDRVDILNEEMPGRIVLSTEDLAGINGDPAGTKVTVRLLVSSSMQNSAVFDY